ncbi:hypothetical protein BK788_14120 [Bacillus thuringiensis serovar sinensis]|nr:hypothetical protein BK788_14120 [Bacillus thuringiensis serovar sinensis]
MLWTKKLARGYKERGMAAYSELQQAEFAAEEHGYFAMRHQREVGTGYFDEVAQVITGGTSATTALKGSTEELQFKDVEKVLKNIGVLNKNCMCLLHFKL